MAQVNGHSFADFEAVNLTPTTRAKPRRLQRLGSLLHRAVSGCALLDADGNLSLTSVVWLSSLALAAYSVIHNSPLGLIPFSVATMSVEHRRHLSRGKLSDQLATVDASIKSLHQLTTEAKQVAAGAQAISLRAEAEAARAVQELGIKSLSQIGAVRPSR